MYTHSPLQPNFGPCNHEACLTVFYLILFRKTDFPPAGASTSFLTGGTFFAYIKKAAAIRSARSLPSRVSFKCLFCMINEPLSIQGSACVSRSERKSSPKSMLTTSASIPSIVLRLVMIYSLYRLLKVSVSVVAGISPLLIASAYMAFEATFPAVCVGCSVCPRWCLSHAPFH